MSYPQKRFRPWRVEQRASVDSPIWKVVTTYATQARADARLNSIVVDLIASGTSASTANALVRVEKHVEFEASR